MALLFPAFVVARSMLKPLPLSASESKLPFARGVVSKVGVLEV